MGRETEGRKEKKRGRWKGRRRKDEERKGGEWETEFEAIFGKPHDRMSTGLLPLPHVPGTDAKPCTSSVSLTAGRRGPGLGVAGSGLTQACPWFPYIL